MKNDTYAKTIDKETIEDFKKVFEQYSNKPNFWVSSEKDTYNELRRVFNRRFDFIPSLILQPFTTEHVAAIVAYVTKHDLQITVKSGGHDHEGESVATGKILIDFSEMNKTETSLPDYNRDGVRFRQIRIQPGARFLSIKKELDKEHLGIPHGTCQSVAIAGYSMGGGWGPWTRKYGMGCERLKGATIVLGNGVVKYLGTSVFYNKGLANEENSEEFDSKLLWAIRGGGGLSYGIITEFFYEPFELPDIATSFHISKELLPVFKKIKATAVIEAWEKVTAPGKYPQLIGTNLKVVAKPLDVLEEASKDAVLDWVMNGHFGGSRNELLELIIEWGKYLVELQLADIDFKANEQTDMFDSVIEGLKSNFDEAANSSNVLTFARGESNGYPYTFESWDRYSSTAKEKGLSLETDCPAPHKITSRMPTENWDKLSREQLVCSLQSSLLKGIENTNISSYITLGAIHGDYYGAPLTRKISALSCAFPYQTRPFTIQYQTWWDMPTQSTPECGCKMDEHTLERVLPTRFNVNRALDWMEECRDYQINETHGSFISFKDASIPTKNYFAQNYDELMRIKLKYSGDKKNLFQSRKTII